MRLPVLASITLSVALMLLLAPQGLSQDQPPASADDPLDVDSLFGSDDEQTETDEAERSESPATESAPSLVSRVLEADPFRVQANARLVLGYSPGWTQPPGVPGEFSALPVVSLSSAYTVDLLISSVLSVRQAISVSYPEYTLRITELSLDYALQDRAFLTLGRTRVAWGLSPNFAFANLPHRRADNPLSSADESKTVVARIAVPIGIGGIDVLVQNKAEYHSDPLQPQANRIGVGAKYNYARERLDVNIGAYYQAGLSARAFASATTTVTDWLELYAEALVADDRLRSDDTTINPEEPVPDGYVEIASDRVISNNNPDYSAGLGVVVALFENGVDLNGEYFYNGEELEGTVVGTPFPLFWGHNVALNADFQSSGLPLRFRVGARYSHTFRSTLLVPRVTWDAARHLTVDLAAGLLWGPEDAGYRAANPDPIDRATYLSITATLNGRL